ncbi:MAG: hypothetical protein RLZZ326_2771 [Planctomycetota bacterium]|jgi:hypothetical protein
MAAHRREAPDLLGIGSTKAGTTWLYRQLCRHPGIWMTPNKEISYFSATHPAGAGRDNPRYRLAHDLLRFGWHRDLVRFLLRLRSLDDWEHVRWWVRFYCGRRDDRWHRSLFARAPQGTLAGEFTPRYESCGDEDIRHMHAIAPHAKLLFMIREPVARFWSHFQMNRARGLAPGDVIAEGLDLLLRPDGKARLQYRETLRNYTRFFRAEQILVIFYDAIRHDPQQLLTEVFEFLEIPCRDYSPAELAERVNEGTAPLPTPESLRRIAVEKYRDDVQTLAQALGGFAADWLDEMNLASLPEAAVGRVRPATVRLTAEIMARLDPQGGPSH